MGVVVGGFVVSKAAQGLDDRVLCLSLASVNDVIDFSDIAEVRVLGLAVLGRYPALMSVGIQIKSAIAEIFSQQSELPHVKSDVFAYIADGAIGTDNHFLIIFRN